MREVKAKQEPAGVKLRVGRSEPCGHRALPGDGPSAGAHVCGTGRGEGPGVAESRSTWSCRGAAGALGPGASPVQPSMEQQNEKARASPRIRKSKPV